MPPQIILGQNSTSLHVPASFSVNKLWQDLTGKSKSNPEKSKLLRFGVDSLYLSYPGVMSEDWDQKLARLKELAQMEDDLNQSIAQVTICEHLFEVRDKGAGDFLMCW